MKAKLIYFKYKTIHIVTLINDIQRFPNILRIKYILCTMASETSKTSKTLYHDLYVAGAGLLFLVHHKCHSAINCLDTISDHCGLLLEAPWWTSALPGPDWIHTGATWQQPLPLNVPHTSCPRASLLMLRCDKKKTSSLSKACTLQKFRGLILCGANTLDQLARVVDG